jgi:hypothetical protein
LQGLSWQTALAASAVSAAEEVREAVRAARVASNAKGAAEAASFQAQAICASSTFTSIEEAKAAQTRMSMAQGHAIHATVVDHETKTVKRRATLALAHDVKCWNMHRKKEMLSAGLEFARSQYEGTRRAFDAWSTLRDGFIGINGLPMSPGLHTLCAAPSHLVSRVSHNGGINLLPDDYNVNRMKVASEGTTLVSVSEMMPIEPYNIIVASGENARENDLVFSECKSSSTPKSESASISEQRESWPDLFMLPFADAAPVIDSNALNLSHSVDSDNMGYLENDLMRDAKRMGASCDRLLNSSRIFGSSATLAALPHDSSFFDTPMPPTPDYKISNGQHLSTSMQSLVDGLLTWGGGFGDDDEDHFVLPQGVAASLLLDS